MCTHNKVMNGTSTYVLNKDTMSQSLSPTWWNDPPTFSKTTSLNHLSFRYIIHLVILYVK